MSMGTSTRTVKTEDRPWPEAEPYLTDIMAEAQRLYRSNVGNEYYPFSTAVPASNQSLDAMDMLEERARAGSPFMSQASEAVQSALGAGYEASPAYTYLSGTAAGQNLTSNPYLDATFDRAADRLTDRVNGAAGLRGRTGSGAHQNLLQTGLSDLSNQIYGDNYQRERERQMSAAATMQGAYEADLARRLAAIEAAQSLTSAGYKDAMVLGQVGAMREQGAQGQLDDLMARYDYEQQAPWTNLSRYNAILNGKGNLGGISKQTTQQSMSPIDTLSAILGLVGGI